MINRELGKAIYAPWNGDRKRIVCAVDPSAQWGNDKLAGQANWIVAMRSRTGLDIRAARSNAVAPRREALRKPMQQMLDGHPGLIVDPEGCRTLREGLGGLFHFAKIRASLGSRAAETPAKNHHSHVCEAAEYLAMDDEAYGEFEGGSQPRARGPRQTEAETD